MSGEHRLYIKLHNGFPEHPKTGDLSDRAFRNLVELWCYCSRNLTDGIVTKTQSKKILTPKSLRELLDAGYVIEHENVYEMHDYLNHQMSAQEVSDLREHRKAAGKLGGKAKANHLASARASALAKAKQTPSKPLPDVDVDVDKEQNLTTRPTNTSATASSFSDDGFPEFWTLYPRSEGKKSAGSAYTKATKRTSADTILSDLRRQLADPNRPEPGFWPHASTWLNGDKWTDVFTVKANGHAPPRPSTSDQRVRAAYEAGQQVMARAALSNNHQFEIGPA